MIIGRDSQTDALRRQQLASGALVRSDGGFRPGGAGSAAPQGLRAAPQMAPLPEMNTFDKWRLEDAAFKVLPGAPGLTVAQRELGYKLARDPINDALKVGEMNLGSKEKVVGGLISGQNQIGYANAIGQNQRAARDAGDLAMSGEFDPLKPLGLNTGGRVPKGLRKGVDKIPAMLTEGEYVLPVDTVEQLGGPEKLDNLVRSTNGQEPGGVPVQKQGLRGYAAGGQVGFYTQANKDLLDAVNAGARKVLPVTQDALNTAATQAEKAWDAGNYAGAAGRVVKGAADVVGALPWDAIEYGRQAVNAVAPHVQNFGRGLSGDTAPAATPPAAPAPKPAAPQTTSATPTPGFVPVQQGKITAPETTLTDLLPGSGEEVMARHEAADKVRGQWQAMAPNGLRGANQGAVDLYNKEQTVRGTGVRALSNNSFDNFGQPAKPQYVGADGKATSDWKNTSGYRDKMMEYASSSSPDLRRKGLMGLRELAARQPQKLDPVKAVELEKAVFELSDAKQKSRERQAQDIDKLTAGLPEAEQRAVNQNMRGEGGVATVSPEQARREIADAKTMAEAIALANQFSIGGKTSDAAVMPIGTDSFGWKDMRFWDDDPTTPNFWQALTSSDGDVIVDKSGRRINAAGLRGATNNLDVRNYFRTK